MNARPAHSDQGMLSVSERSALLPRLLAVTALFAGLCGLTGCASNGPSKAEKLELYRGNAFRYYYLGEFERAQEQAEKGLEIAPDDFNSLLILGRVLQHRGTLETVAQAEEIFRDLVREEPEDYRAYTGLAESLEREGVALDQAAREIESGDLLTEAPDPEARAEELRGRARKRWKEAYETFEQAYELRQATAQANGLQRTASLLGDHESSLGWSDIVLDLLDDQLQAWKEELSRVSLTADEERNWRSRLEEDTDLQVRTLLFKASTLAKLERHTDAVATLDELIDVDPDIAETYSRRAYHLMKVGRYQRAIDSLDRFIEKTIDRPFEDPAVLKAYELLDEAKAKLASTGSDS